MRNGSLEGFAWLRDAAWEPEFQRFTRQLAEASRLFELREMGIKRQLGNLASSTNLASRELHMTLQLTETARHSVAQESAMTRLMLVAQGQKFGLAGQLGEVCKLAEASKAAQSGHLGGVLGAEEAMQRMIKTENAFASRFRLTFEDLIRSSPMFDPSLGHIVSKAFDEHLTSIAHAIKTPWIEPESVHRSFDSLASLQALSENLCLPTFGMEESRLVRKALGDWRGVTLPEQLFSDSEARQCFYAAQGFDSNLTGLPEPAFTEALHLTALSAPEVFSRIPLKAQEQAGTPPSADPAVAVGQRMVQSYTVLFRFERRIRSFLARTMTERYGRGWWKQRVPGPILSEWRRKSAEAKEKGSAPQPLIEYADFTDYVNIILRGDNWNEIFSQVFLNKDDLAVSFQRLFPLRLCTMHSREISKEDFLLLTVETSRISKAIVAVNPIDGDAGDDEC